MTTIKLYLTSNALTGEATVTQLSDNRTRLRLNQTLFHPQGGGQPADEGLIGSVRVKGVRHHADGDVDHFMAAPCDLEIGDKVEMTVDSNKRCLNSRYHSGGHLIADALEAGIPGLKAVQGHHWPGEARVEFEGAYPGCIPSVASAQEMARHLIDANTSFVIVGEPFTSRALKIGSSDPVGCGGTHVQNSSELNSLVITKLKLRKGRLRVSYTV